MNGSGLDIIARIETPFAEKFGVPRQSGIADCPGRIVFEKPFRDVDAVRGLEGFSHIWLIWQFDRAQRQSWSPTVRPPRLGGNERVGVFATRSPFRPNGLGLSAVELERVALDEPEGPVLYVRGADMVSGTPIVDIKPYLAYADSYPDAAGGFTGGDAGAVLTVDFPPELLAQFDSGQRHGLLSALAADPRPRYQDDPDRVYGMAYAGKNVRFTVQDVTIYTDGACSGNPGPGGWGAILSYKGTEKELSGGAAQTTNNRMELTAVIEALRLLKEPCVVELYSDSKYVIDALEKGWARSWQQRGWVKSDKKPALNPDLWEQLLALTDIHEVRCHWVKGHAENEKNNRCDQMAVAESRKFQ